VTGQYESGKRPEFFTGQATGFYDVFSAGFMANFFDRTNGIVTENNAYTE
jgi:hypothetical protein